MLYVPINPFELFESTKLTKSFKPFEPFERFNWFRHPKELCSLGVLLRIVSGEGWGRRRFQEEEGAGEEMGTETPPPPFCLPEGGGRLPRAPTYGYASTGKGRPPPGEPPGEREASPREAPS